MFTGLRAGLGTLSSRITAVQTYELSDTDLNAQIARLRASHADTIMIFALPTQTIQAFLAIRKLGWRPRIFVNSVSIDPFVMDVVQRNTGKKLVEGVISSQFLKDPTDPALAKDPGVKLYKQILRRYLPGRKGAGGRAPVRDGGRVHDGRRAAPRRRAADAREPPSSGDASERAQPVPRQGRDRADGPERLLPDRAHADAALPLRPVAPVRRPRQRPLSGSIEIRTLTDGGQQAVDVAKQVASFLGEARRSLDLAQYDFHLAPETAALVGGAIKDAAARGVAVRMIYDVGHRNPIPVPPPPEPDVELISSLGRAAPADRGHPRPDAPQVRRCATARPSGPGRRTGRTTRGRARRT